MLGFELFISKTNGIRFLKGSNACENKVQAWGRRNIKRVGLCTFSLSLWVSSEIERPRQRFREWVGVSRYEL